MEKDIALGSVGGVKLILGGGKAVVEIDAGKQVLSGAISLKSVSSAEVDAMAFADMLFAEIEAKSPAGAVAIEETVKMVIKSAIAAIQ